MNTLGGLGGILGGLFLLAAFVALVALTLGLVLAPLKLYEIARELRQANVHLKYSHDLQNHLIGMLRFYMDKSISSGKPPEVPPTVSTPGDMGSRFTHL
jgi:hypothetical protein